MKLHAPFIISARLMPALRIGEATLSLEAKCHHVDHERRHVASFYLDGLPNERSHLDRTLRSGVGGGWSEVETFEAFLSFLIYAAETEEDTRGMFPTFVVDWARDNLSELQAAQCDLSDLEGSGVQHHLIEA